MAQPFLSLMGSTVDYVPAVTGSLRIVPEGKARAALSEDYAAMVEDQLLLDDAPSFDALMQACAEVEATANELRTEQT